MGAVMTQPFIPIRCPWIEEHSCDSGPTETIYFPASTGSFECGHFKCLHASHEGKTDADFLAAIGYAADGFEDISDGSEASLASFVGEEDFVGDLSPTIVTPHPLVQPAFDRDKNTSKIKPHLNNLLTWLRWAYAEGYGVAFDVFRDEYMLDTPTGRRDFVEQDYTRLQASAEAGSLGFSPVGRQLFRDAVRLAALEHCYDSAQQWLATLPMWDGVPRVYSFAAHYFGATDDAHARAVSRYLWTAMPGRILSPGIQADMTLVLVSPQGTRKSSAIRAMAPYPDCFTEVSFSDGEADLARLTKGKTLVEIPELKGLRSREIEWIKAFVTKRENSWVPKYFEMKTVYHRRFLMIGSTNEEEFLADPTGERRWLPLTVTQIDDAAIRRDHTQLWAEGVVLYKEHGILWHDAQASALERHDQYTIHDAIVDKIADWLDSADSITKERPGDREHVRLLDVWKELWPGSSGLPSKGDQMRISDALTRLGYERVQKRVAGRNQKVWVPKRIHLAHNVLRWIQ
jgi:hypothetical protein